MGEVASLMAVTATILAAIRWSHNRLHEDMMEIKAQAKSAHERIDATGARIDAQGARIDAMYEIIIKMLDKR